MVRESGKPPVRGKTSPYGFFVKMCYEEHKKKYPNENVQVTEISKKCSEKWKTMTDEEKRRFYELAQKDAERYQAEVAAYGGEEAMRKRKRAKKDPNAPKRALSAFFFFSSQKRPEVQAANPEWKVSQVAQELGRRWKDLTEEEKRNYEQMAVQDKNRYEQEMRDYKETGKKPASRMETNAAAMAAVGMPQPPVIPQQPPPQPLQANHQATQPPQEAQALAPQTAVTAAAPAAPAAAAPPAAPASNPAGPLPEEAVAPVSAPANPPPPPAAADQTSNIEHAQ